MSKLKPFQQATVRVVLKAFSRKDSSHRFLIADEVGLGKTLVAGEIIRRMAKSSSHPIVVLYVCSNLSIAAQNKRKLLEWLPEDERKIAVSPVDRLTLLPEHQMQGGSQVRLYTLTPDTSIPMRGGRHSDGRKEERALIHALVKKIWPDFFVGRSNG
ncbi:MAG: DEAD/DEAH box helicase family protein, partial [Pseudomonadota bacterium]